MAARRPKYAAKPDANQPADVKRLQDLGFVVILTAQWFSCGDFVVWGYDLNRDEMRLTWWEWKTEEGELTDTQQELMTKYPGLWLEGNCVEDVLREYGRLPDKDKGE